jgi:phage-related protein
MHHHGEDDRAFLVRPAHFVGSALRDLRELPEDVQGSFGRSILRAQRGGTSPGATPLKGFGGAGVVELHEDYDGDTYRAVYTTRFALAVYVLHVFQKKSYSGRATPKRHLDVIRDRLKAAEADYAQRYSGSRG